MLAQMNEESMQLIVQGPDGRSRGLVQCALQKTRKYDHKRHHALRQSGKGGPNPNMLYIWDFVVLRDDGTVAGLHPNFSNNNIEYYEGMAEEHMEIPATGKGGTNGPGTFQYFIKKGVQRKLRFDGRKRPA